MTACQQLALLAEYLAEESLPPRDYVRRLGYEAGGIRPGLAGVLDLARGGRNRVPGRGMRDVYDDGSAGQVRHFAGTAAGAARFGPRLMLWLSVHVTRDRPHSPDGRLSAVAIDFAQQILEGNLHPRDAAEWITRNVCE